MSSLQKTFLACLFCMSTGFYSIRLMAVWGPLIMFFAGMVYHSYSTAEDELDKRRPPEKASLKGWILVGVSLVASLMITNLESCSWWINERPKHLEEISQLKEENHYLARDIATNSIRYGYWCMDEGYNKDQCITNFWIEVDEALEEN